MKMYKVLTLLLLVYNQKTTSAFDYNSIQYACYQDSCNYEKYCNDDKERCEFCSNKFSLCFTPRQIPNCTVFCMLNKPCPHLGHLEHGSENHTDRQYWLGETVTFTCDEGFHNIGPETSKCTEYGIWSHQQLGVQPPKCEAVNQDEDSWMSVAITLMIVCAVLIVTIIVLCNKLKNNKRSREKYKTIKSRDDETELNKYLLEDGPDSVDTKNDRSVQHNTDRKGLPPRTELVEPKDQERQNGGQHLGGERLPNVDGTNSTKPFNDTSMYTIQNLGILVTGDGNNFKQGRNAYTTVNEISTDNQTGDEMPESCPPITTIGISETVVPQNGGKRDSDLRPDGIPDQLVNPMINTKRSSMLEQGQQDLECD